MRIISKLPNTKATGNGQGKLASTNIPNKISTEIRDDGATQTCTDWYLVTSYYDQYGDFMYSTETYIGTTCTSGGYVGPPPLGGGSTNVVYDCAGEPNGTAYVDQECDTCIGGTTGITECAEITEKIKNECLNEVWLSLKGNLDNKIINLLHTTFGQNHSINFKIVDGNVNGGAPAQSQVTKNSYNNSGEKVFDVKVTLNKNTMPEYSQEFVASTIVHEIMHAYFNANKIYYNQQFQQHQAMAEGYIESMTSTVKELFPSLPNKSAYALALNGFNDMFENNLDGWNALLTKYQLTNQEIYDTQVTYKSNAPTAPGTKCPLKP